MKKLIYAFFVVFALNTEGVFSQDRFRATVITGLNFAQIDGDLQNGYSKKGISLGISGGVIFKPNFDISLEAFYNQKGTNPVDDGTFQQSRYRCTIDLKYADVMAILNFHAFPHRSQLYYIQTLKIGASYGRLLNSSFDMLYNGFSQPNYAQEILRDMRKDDFSLVVGIAWQLTPQLGIMIRHTNSLSRIYDNNKPLNVPPLSPAFLRPKNITYLKPYNFSISTFFHFISPHKTVKVVKPLKE